MSSSVFFYRIIKPAGFAAVFLLLFSSFSPPAGRTEAILVIHFRALVHGTPLQLNKEYRSPFGEPFQISRFRFYAGRIAPLYTERRFHTDQHSAYKLIDFSDTASCIVQLAVRPGDFNGIQFQLGIDSAEQVSGAQTGALDPVKGMFWTWNSGYQSLKIEGTSSVSAEPAHAITYHIGGYRNPYSTVWNLRINTMADEVFRLSADKKIIVEIPIELDYFFNGPTPLHFKEISSCMTPGELSRKISEDFVGSFTGLNLLSIP